MNPVAFNPSSARTRSGPCDARNDPGNVRSMRVEEPELPLGRAQQPLSPPYGSDDRGSRAGWGGDHDPSSPKDAAHRLTRCGQVGLSQILLQIDLDGPADRRHRDVVNRVVERMFQVPPDALHRKEAEPEQGRPD